MARIFVCLLLMVAACGPATTSSPQGSTAAIRGSKSVTLPAALGGGTAQAAFSSSTPSAAASKHGNGALAPDSPAPPRVRSATASPPASVDLSSDAPAPGDQEATGSCQSWAAGYTSLAWWANHSGVGGARFSPMYLYAQIARGNPDIGAPIETPMQLLQSQGIDTQMHYEPMQQNLDCATQPTSDQKTNAANFKISGYERLDLSQGVRAAIMEGLAAGHPVVIGFLDYPGFDNASATHYVVGAPQAGDHDRGGHAVTVMAYDSDGMWILNSWGTSWGRNGWALLSWDFVDSTLDGKATVNDAAAITGIAFTCKNSNATCDAWQLSDQCQANPSYMLDNCCVSCANPDAHLPAATQWFRIQNVWLGNAYSFDDGSMAPTGNYSGQLWKLTPLGNDRFRLTNQFEGDGMSFDTDIMAASGNYTGQSWTLSPWSADDNSVYRLTNDYKGSAQSLQPSAANQPVELGTTGDYSGQQWTITLQ